MKIDQDPLQPLPADRWSELMSVFLSDWPRSLPGYNTLETQLRYKEENCEYWIQVYSLFGDLSNGFIATNTKANEYKLIIQYPKDDTSVLEEALRTTKVIDWNIPMSLLFISEHSYETVKKVIKDKDIGLNRLLSTTFIIEKGSPLFDDVSLPPGFKFELLSSEHVNLVDLKWPHRYPGSSKYFELLINTKSGYGLFREGQLISWILISECGYLTHLYTLEDYRKQGLAQLILRLLSNEFLKTNRQVFVFCVEGNDNAYKLYNKMGFKISSDISWVNIKKKST